MKYFVSFKNIITRINFILKQNIVYLKYFQVYFPNISQDICTILLHYHIHYVSKSTNLPTIIH